MKMKALQTLTKTGSVKKSNGVMQEYSLCDANSNLIATVVQKTKDKNIHEILWFGGEKHGKSDLIDGGIEGLMNFVGGQS
jgi:hypothetical protein